MDLPLVGREDELAWLRSRLSSLDGRMLVIGGEAGVGKSHLVAEGIAQAAPSDLLVSVTACPGPDAAAPLAPWRTVLEPYGTRQASLPPPLGSGAPCGDLSDLAAALAAMLSSGPKAVLVMEDIHWADTESLDLLCRIAPRLKQSPAVVVVTYRTDEPARHHPVHSRIPALIRSGAERLSLGRLTEPQIVELARAAGQPFRGRAIYARSGGNPFFARELLAADAEAIPETLAQMMAQRLRELDPQTVDTLRIAALLGMQFDFHTLQVVLEKTEEQVATELEEAIDQNLIAETDQRFAFRQPLLREVLCARMLTIRQKRWHRRIAQVTTDTDAVAYHLGRAGDPEAVPHLLAAGRRALQGGADAQAYEHCRCALELAAAEDPLRPELLLLAGYAHRHADYDLAGAYLQQALDAARESGDSVVMALARHGQAWLWGEQGLAKAPSVMDAAHRDLAAVWSDPRLATLQGLVDGSPPRQPGTTTGLALAYFWSGRSDAAEAIIQSTSRESGLPASPDDHWILGECALIRCDLDEAFHRFRRSADEALSHHRYQVAAYRLAVLLDYLVMHRGTERPLIQETATCLAETWRLASSNSPAEPTGNGAPLLALHFLQGDWNQLRHEIDTYHSFGQQPPNAWSRYHAHWAARLACEQGDAVGTHRALTGSRGLPPGGPGAKPDYGDYSPQMAQMTLMARALRLAGDRENARAWLNTVDAWCQGPRPSIWNGAQNLIEWAELHRDEGDLASAEAMAQEALRLGRESGATTSLILHARRILGSLGGPEASNHLEAALQLAQQAESPYLVALVLADRRLGNDLCTAKATFASLGAGPDLARVAALMKQSAPPPPPGGLTRRELQIAQLVVRGLSDREIATDLFISPRTVDGHLRNIFTKVEVTSRAALAVWAVRNGLADQHIEDNE